MGMMPLARSSTKSTIRIFSSISSTTTSQQKIASSNSSRKSSGNEKRERESRRIEAVSKFKRTFIYFCAQVISFTLFQFHLRVRSIHLSRNPPNLYYFFCFSENNFFCLKKKKKKKKKS